MPLPKPTEKYTYTDYLTWDDDFRCELVNGEVIEMEHPTTEHQSISGALACQFGMYLQDKTCEILYAPLDVMIFAKLDNYEDEVDTVVQPDLLIVCDSSKLVERGCVGAPDMLIEITSLHAVRYDSIDKAELYAKAGVKEYWIVDPISQFVDVLLLDTTIGAYRLSASYTRQDSAPVNTLKGLCIDLSRVFPERPTRRPRKFLSEPRFPI